MSPESKQTPTGQEQTPTQRLDKYIASLGDRHDFGVEDRGYILSVRRSPDSEHTEPWPDSGWFLATKGVDKNGVTVGIVEKFLNPDDETPARKKVVLAEALAYSAEIARSKAPQVELADRALEITGPTNPSVIEPFNDPSSNAMSGVEAAAFMSEVRQSAPQAEVIEPETEREMLDRHIREYQAQLSQLYKEHRGVDPRSDRAQELVNLIEQTKDDIGRVDRARRNLPAAG